MSPVLAVGLAMALLVTGALLVILATTLLNLVTFPRLRVPAGVPAGGPISILVPARDEAASIGATLAGLRALSGDVAEILVLDDGSTDGTAEVVRTVAAGDPRVRLLAGAPLPAGWAGKPWACHQLAQAARAPLLLFTDADTGWEPGALAALLAERARGDAALLTAWPTQETRTWAERLTVPLIAFAIWGYLPVIAVHRLRSPAFAAAVGQCLLFTREGYAAAGGHAAIAGEVLDDVALARAVKRSGGRLRVADGAGLVRCRMYRDWPGARDGLAKSMLAGYGGRVAGLVAATLFHLAILVLPWLWLAAGLLAPGIPGWPAWPLLLIALGVAARALSAAATRQRIGDALLLPVSALLFTVVAARAAAWARSGGVVWKGRTIPPAGAAR